MTANYLHWQPMQPFSRSSEQFIWIMAVVLSLSVHLVLILQRQPLITSPATVTQETITHIRFSTLAPTPINHPEAQVTQAIPPPKPITRQQQQPPEKPRPKAKTSPKPEAKKKPLHKAKSRSIKKPLPQKPPAVKPIPRYSQQASTRNKTVETTITAAKPAAPAPETNHLLIKQTRLSYKALLMRHIEVHKHYPRVARKRNIQGNILVSFTLLADGSIKNLHLSGKKSILKKATQQAINNALPMPRPPKDLTFPMEIKFNMNYSLK